MRVWSVVRFFCFLLVAPMAMGLDPFYLPDIDLSLLPGTWSSTVGDMTNTLTFNSDQTFAGELRQNSKVIDRYQGTWDTKIPDRGGPKLVWKYTQSSRMPLGSVEQDTFEKLTAKYLVIWTKNGSHTYSRVQAPAARTP